MGFSVAEFTERYGYPSEEVGIKVQVLPGLAKTDKGYRGVLMIDPLVPGLRYLHTRRSTVAMNKMVENKATASVADLAYDIEAKLLDQSNPTSQKLKPCALTEANILQRLQEQNLVVPELLRMSKSHDSSDDEDAYDSRSSKPQAQSPSSPRVPMASPAKSIGHPVSVAGSFAIGRQKFLPSPRGDAASSVCSKPVAGKAPEDCG